MPNRLGVLPYPASPVVITSPYTIRMQNESNQQRIKMLYQMLFEMATGNLSFRIQQTAHQ
ncbi:hypothetical protein [Flavobacterium sp.]|uniref:hypothetical protein n=1 Tax=Flavobacterium sp. TaxID=239 RepID=UPI002B4AF904|nr:hypothetical protein [Flavobacterium sp.]HLF51248.1 hypothetical protein [Flavobacterium sp.]